MNYKSKPEVVALMKYQITELVFQLRIPANVRSFGELHDFIDANELGGMCLDEFDRQWSHTIGEDTPEPWMTFCNECQDEIHKWLEDGYLELRIEQTPSDSFTPQTYGELLRDYRQLLSAVDTATYAVRGDPEMLLNKLRTVWLEHRGKL